MKSFLNPEGHQNRISGSKVMVILLKGLLLLIGRLAPGRVCTCSLRSRLVFTKKNLTWEVTVVSQESPQTREVEHGGVVHVPVEGPKGQQDPIGKLDAQTATYQLLIKLSTVSLTT